MNLWTDWNIVYLCVFCWNSSAQLTKYLFKYQPRNNAILVTHILCKHKDQETIKTLRVVTINQHNLLYMDLTMNNMERELRKIHIAVILIWICNVGVIKTDNYFTSNAENFDSVPTTIKTYENDTVLLPCYPSGKWITIHMGKECLTIQKNSCNVFWVFFFFDPVCSARTQ